jgi:hypothetical protein
MMPIVSTIKESRKPNVKSTAFERRRLFNLPHHLPKSTRDGGALPLPSSIARATAGKTARNS